MNIWWRWVGWGVCVGEGGCGRHLNLIGLSLIFFKILDIDLFSTTKSNQKVKIGEFMFLMVLISKKALFFSKKQVVVVKSVHFSHYVFFHTAKCETLASRVTFVSEILCHYAPKGGLYEVCNCKSSRKRQVLTSFKKMHKNSSKVYFFWRKLFIVTKPPTNLAQMRSECHLI